MEHKGRVADSLCFSEHMFALDRPVDPVVKPSIRPSQTPPLDMVTTGADKPRTTVRKVAPETSRRTRWILRAVARCSHPHLRGRCRQFATGIGDRSISSLLLSPGRCIAGFSDPRCHRYSPEPERSERRSSFSSGSSLGFPLTIISVNLSLSAY